MGCVKTLPTKPPKPTLKIEKQADGGICLDRENSKELGKYILNLEQSYN
jgi:hypothetical protein